MKLKSSGRKIKTVFNSFDGEYIRFERVENPPCQRPDLTAFLLLERLAPGEGDLVSAAEHDEVYLSTDCKALAEVVTEDDILTLVRCGVRFDEDYKCLALFV